ncbi:radical SAM family heme chaperone HemW [Butyrivibrio fibrisolvens]|uniref:radical SAM family heme chaperone HemW n=1 Tax=Butyrivibrio fibrisolvens TaxID=831 RepID=UPI00041E9DD6|nr:radical SAM family heme chaperone HemW [Butyrivibrio fibrisolvens]
MDDNIKHDLNTDNNKIISIYIHIPFCVRKCKYCDFLSFPAAIDVQTRYLEALIKEIERGAAWLQDKGYTPYVKSIFLGGGTPSSVDPKWIVKILDTVRRNYNVAADAEITMEMNPGTATPESLSVYKKAGINRLSIGCQSLNDDELKELGRIHDAKTFYETFSAAREAGFDNINVDLMSALPGQSVRSYTDTLKGIIELRPEHISAYSLIIEEGTPFYDKYKDVIDRDLYDIEDELVKEGVVLKTPCEDDKEAAEKVIGKVCLVKPLPTEEEERKMYEETIDILTKNGYHRYEVSNYARDDGDYECYHNKAYWKRADYLGFGIGAAGMVDDERFTNTDDINTYCKYWEGIDICYPPLEDTDNTDTDINDTDNTGAADSKMSYKYTKRPLLEHDKLSIKACMEETMFLGLRMDEGVSVSDFERKFGSSIQSVYGNTIDKLDREALVVIENGYIKLTEKGLEVSNAVLSEFLLDD